MGSPIQCFWLSPTERVRLRLRRYSRGNACANDRAYHNADLLFLNEDGSPSWPVKFSSDHPGSLASYEDVAPPHDDPRWPTSCEACGYQFTDSDHWQVFQSLLYTRGDNGELCTLRDAPPGAMYDASWYPEKGPDGIALCVCLPPGGGDDYWHVDGPSRNGGGWTRQGKPPRVTAQPSILTPRYHGWLRDGYLVEC